MTLQRAGSNPQACVLLRLPWGSGKDGESLFFEHYASLGGEGGVKG